LWSIFETHYQDPGTFVPSVTAVVVAWCDAFGAWLERDENEESVDKLLDYLKTVGRLELILNVWYDIALSGFRSRVRSWRIQTSNEGVQTRTTFDQKKRSFEIVLPSSKSIQTSGLEAKFVSDLLQLFNGVPKTASKISAVAEDPEWADVSMHSPIIPHAPESQLRIHSGDEVPDSLPDIASIPRPEELIKKPPYWLIVRQERKDLVHIEGSHGPSMAVLEAYLKKWCRGEAARVNRVSSISRYLLSIYCDFLSDKNFWA
jgi:hypothetical protein